MERKAYDFFGLSVSVIMMSLAMLMVYADGSTFGVKTHSISLAMRSEVPNPTTRTHGRIRITSAEGVVVRGGSYL